MPRAAVKHVAIGEVVAVVELSVLQDGLTPGGDHDRGRGAGGIYREGEHHSHDKERGAADQRSTSLAGMSDRVVECGLTRRSIHRSMIDSVADVSPQS